MKRLEQQPCNQAGIDERWTMNDESQTKSKRGEKQEATTSVLARCAI